MINGEVKEFSRADTERSIPCICDGLKIVQRIILTCIFKYLNKKCKVQYIVGQVMASGHYGHGDTSVSGAIINMSRRFQNRIPYTI